jgi:hypothetical protein
MNTVAETSDTQSTILGIGPQLEPELTGLNELAAELLGQVPDISKYANLAAKHESYITQSLEDVSLVALVRAREEDVTGAKLLIETYKDNPKLSEELRASLHAVSTGDFEGAANQIGALKIRDSVIAQSYLAFTTGADTDLEKAQQAFQQRKKTYYSGDAVTASMGVVMARAGHFDEAQYVADYMGDQPKEDGAKLHIERAIAIGLAQTGRAEEARQVLALMDTSYKGRPGFASMSFTGGDIFAGYINTPLGERFRAETYAQVAAVTNADEDWEATERNFDLMESNFTGERGWYPLFFRLLDKDGGLDPEDKLTLTLECVREAVGQDVDIELYRGLSAGNDIETIRTTLETITSQDLRDEDDEPILDSQTKAEAWLHLAAATGDPTDIAQARTYVEKHVEDSDYYSAEGRLWLHYNLAVLSQDPQDVSSAKSWLESDYDWTVNYQSELQARLAVLLKKHGRDDEARQLASIIDKDEYDEEDDSPDNHALYIHTAYDALKDGQLDEGQKQAMIDTIRLVGRQLLDGGIRKYSRDIGLLAVANIKPLLQEAQTRDE